MSAAPSTGLDGVLGSTLQAGLNLYGSQNAAEAQTTGELAGIGTQQTAMGNINSLYSGQSALGNGAFGSIGTSLGIGGGSNIYSPYTSAGAGAAGQAATFLGLNGQPANPQAFLSTPGYQTAVQQGTNAINSQAAAAGNLYTPNTLAQVGGYVTNTADQYYNNYVSNLLQSAQMGLSGASTLGSNLLSAGGLGSSANQGLSGANLTTSGNIAQLQQNTGNAQASQYGALAGNISGLISGLNSSGALSSFGGAVSNGISSLFGGNSYNSDAIANTANQYGADASLDALEDTSGGVGNLDLTGTGSF
jgi:hypothetical protein